MEQQKLLLSSSNLCNLHCFFFLMFFFIFFCLPHPSDAAANKYNISALFAFGDSTLDTGNNNPLPTFIRANHPPYGRDFPGDAPTGRFSDGKLVIDFLASTLGLKDAMPAYINARGLSAAELSTGISFASGGSGFDETTAAIALVLSMQAQLMNFKEYSKMLAAAVGGEDAAGRIIEDALFMVGAGSNDWVANYYSNPLRNKFYNVTAYSHHIIQKMQSFVQELYNQGARKMTISGLPPIGCVPFEITRSLIMKPNFLPKKRKCIESENEAAVYYNTQLQDAIKSMSSSLQGIHIEYMDIYTPLFDMVKNPKKYGFEETTLGCCGTGAVEMGPLCNAFARMCQDPSKYVFWDAMHPTQATYVALADYITRTFLPKF